jgi:hypothetical protein
VVTYSREATLPGIAVPAKPIQPVSFATLAFDTPITKATKSTFIAPHLVDAAIVVMPKLGK